MKNSSLERFIRKTNAAWAPLSSELVATVRDELQKLITAPLAEDWLTNLRRERPVNKELYRDPSGFVLLAHAEPAGLYRPPHDHGRNWVMYGVLDGEIEMGTYGRLASSDGAGHLVKRGSSVLRAGEVEAYLPGDIHDTRCVSNSALLLRFTERDLRKDDSEGYPVTRYVQRDGLWTPGTVA